METLISRIVGSLAGLAIFVSMPALLDGAVDAEAVIEEFLQLSMLKEEAKLYNIFQSNQTKPVELGKKVDPEPRKAVETLQDVIRSENILSYMKGYLRRELLNGSTPELMVWLQSSLTQKMVELGHRDINPVEFDSYSNSLKVSPPPAERVALLKRLDTDTVCLSHGYCAFPVRPPRRSGRFSAFGLFFMEALMSSSRWPAPGLMDSMVC